MSKIEYEKESNNDEDILQSSRAREIVHEILNFGVSQYQIQKIIKFLSFELEDRNLMLKLLNSLEEDDSLANKIEI